MNCQDVQIVISSWEKTGRIERNELENMTNHTERCFSCHQQYSLLITLMSRDIVAPNDMNRSIPNLSIDLSSRIMSTIKKDGKQPKKKSKYGPALIYTAAALLIMTLGFNSIINEYKKKSDISTQVIVFRITVPDAVSVTLVGDFTDWIDNKIILTDSDQDGIWETSVSLKSNNIYTYKYLIDGKTWLTDPESDFIIDDGFGGTNSFIQL